MMSRPTTVRFRASLLLAVLAMWFANVALCCAVSSVPAENPAPACHHPAGDDAGTSDHATHADGACCVGIKVFPVQAGNAELAAAPAASVPMLFLTWADSRLPAPVVLAVRASDTGPPERSSFAERVLQRSLPGRAPPAIA